MYEFFENTDVDYRNTVRRDINNSRGYTDNELTKRLVDAKQVFDVGPDFDDNAVEIDEIDGSNRWPNVTNKPNLTNFRSTIENYYLKCAQISSVLMDALLSSIDDFDNERKNIAFNSFANHTSLFRLNYYPRTNTSIDIQGDGSFDSSPQFGVSHHTDSGGLTLIWQSSPGLEVYTGSKQEFNDGRWAPVDPQPNAMTVNIGDMFQVWSNGLIKAPEHRVRATPFSNHPRYSAAFFFNPSYDSIIEPIINTNSKQRYRPINWGYFRRQRFLGDFADFGKEIQIEDFYIPNE
eukprot:gene17757-23357_t